MWTKNKLESARYLNMQVTREVGQRVWAAYVKRYPDKRWLCDLREEGTILAMYESGKPVCYWGG